jgi:hypothetical protein
MEVPKMYVFFDGPFADNTKSDVEVPYWTVYVATDIDSPTNKLYTIYNFAKAQALANNIARDRKIEIYSSAVTAN